MGGHDDDDDDDDEDEDDEDEDDDDLNRSLQQGGFNSLSPDKLSYSLSGPSWTVA